MIRVILLALLTCILFESNDAWADYRLCNETSYVANAAIGVSANSSVETRGWLEIYPGKCRVVDEGLLDADKYYFYIRVPTYYDSEVTGFESGIWLCVGSNDFLISNATECTSSAYRLKRFIEVNPKIQGDDWELALAEEAKFTRDQAALAGVQRLLGMLGYDAGRIDGVAGGQTNSALKAFSNANGGVLSEELGPALYGALLRELKARQAGVGLQVCNETRHLVWMALGIPDGDVLVSRGWYRVGAGECLRPYKEELDGSVIFSFGEAVDEDGLAVIADNIPLIWDGDTVLCTQSTRFKIEEHTKCEIKGMTPTRFRKIELGGAKSFKIRYTAPR